MALIGAIVSLPIAAAAVGVAMVSNHSDENEYDVNRYVNDYTDSDSETDSDPDEETFEETAQERYKEEYRQDRDNRYDRHEDYMYKPEPVQLQAQVPTVPTQVQSNAPTQSTQQANQKSQMKKVFTPMTTSGASRGRFQSQNHVDENAIFQNQSQERTSFRNTDYQPIQYSLDDINQEKTILKSDYPEIKHMSKTAELNRVPIDYKLYDQQRTLATQDQIGNLSGGSQFERSYMPKGLVNPDPNYTGYQQTTHIPNYLPYTNQTDYDEMPTTQSAATGVAQYPNDFTDSIRSMPQIQNTRSNQSFAPVSGSSSADTQTIFPSSRMMQNMQYPQSAASSSSMNQTTQPTVLLGNPTNVDASINAGMSTGWSIYQADTDTDRTGDMNQNVLSNTSTTNPATGTAFTSSYSDSQTTETHNTLTVQNPNTTASNSVSVLQPASESVNTSTEIQNDRPLTRVSGGVNLPVQSTATVSGNNEVEMSSGTQNMDTYGWNTASVTDSYGTTTQTSSLDSITNPTALPSVSSGFNVGSSASFEGTDFSSYYE